MSTLRRVIGEGSSKGSYKTGLYHRISFVLLMPLTCIVLLRMMPSLGKAWGSESFSWQLWMDQGFLRRHILVVWGSLLMYHGMLSLKIMIEDYVHGVLAKLSCLMAVYGVTIISVLFLISNLIVRKC